MDPLELAMKQLQINKQSRLDSRSFNIVDCLRKMNSIQLWPGFYFKRYFLINPEINMSQTDFSPL